MISGHPNPELSRISCDSQFASIVALQMDMQKFLRLIKGLEILTKSSLKCKENISREREIILMLIYLMNPIRICKMLN